MELDAMESEIERLKEKLNERVQEFNNSSLISASPLPASGGPFGDEQTGNVPRAHSFVRPSRSGNDNVRKNRWRRVFFYFILPRCFDVQYF